MAKASIILFVVALFSLQAVAQESSLTEYVITLSNDTLYGEIHPGLGSKSVTFTAPGNASVEYSTDQIKGYKKKNDTFYVPKTFTLSEKDSRTVYAQALVMGKLSLFKFSDIFLLTKDDSIAIEIQKQEKIEYVDNQKVMRTSYRNLGALFYLLGDCTTLAAKDKLKKVSERTLTNMVVAYNECTESIYTEFKKDKAWTKLNVGLGAGMNVSGIDFSSAFHSDYAFITDANFEKSKTPVYMASFIFSSPRRSERISFRTDIMYTQSNYKGTYLEERYGFRISYDFDVSVQSFIVPLSMQYVLPNELFSPYINLGINLHKNFNRTTKYVKERELLDKVYSYEREDLFLLNKQHLSYGGAVGIMRKISNKSNGFIELRAFAANYFHSSDDYIIKQLKSELVAFSLLGGIRF